MPPVANMGKSRKMALYDDSDSDSDAYEEKLKQAEAARIRLRQAKEDRDKRREAVSLAYQRSASAIHARVEKSIAKYNDLHSAMRIRHFKRLKKAVDTRDQKLEAIAAKMGDVQQLMANHGSHLNVLYGGRRAKVAKLVEEKEKAKESGAGGAAQGVDAA
ncbi:hypothetical protein QBC39DRAFT_262281 [Podospora conica]|nr:hypothetical protein QBC39DRAFT_262281 [Schizothecium conicum]